MPFFIKTELIKKEYFVSAELRKKTIKKHIDWINRLQETGVNIKSGYLIDEEKKPGGGGLLIIESSNYKEAKDIISNDPMIKKDLVNWQLHEWKEIS